MRKNNHLALRDVERTQEELKRNIAESARLIGQAQDAITRFREEHGEVDPASDQDQAARPSFG